MADMDNQDFCEETEYLIYSSKVGIVFRQAKGRFLVDNTYSYSVHDDAQKIMRGNKAIEEKPTAKALKDWARMQRERRAQSRRRVPRYDADFRLVVNESGMQTPDAGAAVPVATAIGPPPPPPSYARASVVQKDAKVQR
jgi:hypothetical protein